MPAPVIAAGAVATGTNKAIGTGVGVMQMIQAARAKRKADSAFPSLVDPEQAGFLAELNQKKKAINTGADFAVGMNAIDETTAGTQDAIVQSTGGDVGGTIQGLIQAQRAGDKGKNQVLATGQESQKYYTGLYGDVLKNISSRKMELQLARYNQNMMEWAGLAGKGTDNVMAGTSLLTGNKGVSPAPATPPIVPAGTQPASGGINWLDIFKRSSSAQPGTVVPESGDFVKPTPQVAGTV